MGGAPIGAGGHDPPPFEAKGDGRHDLGLGIIYISHCSYHATLLSTPGRFYPGVWAVAHHAVNCYATDGYSEMTTILTVRGNQDYLLTYAKLTLKNTKITKNISIIVSQKRIRLTLLSKH